MPIRKKHIRAQGKLLLTGEYAVLDGAWALALPTHYGQSLHIETTTNPSVLSWSARDSDNSIWLEAEFEMPDLVLRHSSDLPTARTLQSILLACRRQNTGFLSHNQGIAVTTQTDFPRQWGLGASSTLIAALARWAGADPYKVLFETLGGSGYDLACAFASGPVLYRLSGQTPEIRPAAFYPPFADQLYFVFLGKKQDSRAGIARYRQRAGARAVFVEAISALTQQCLLAQNLPDFEMLMQQHETVVGQFLDLPCVRELYFPDYWGVVKSLGAWGGDFVLAASARPAAETAAYFHQKGYAVCIPYREMTIPGKPI